ncbi:hypothetical protein NHX12_034376 [Muraenolepis orangiensis]|uniref:Uncharacterized protein n=1 Tax=Muraenolepis orangiensis TaxID=630683 RepID=A0A9Q0D468_9TELE|nr:hypothetical protein NHX12_034376 [Muraenolepis orangiensis]
MARCPAVMVLTDKRCSSGADKCCWRGAAGHRGGDPGSGPTHATHAALPSVSSRRWQRLGRWLLALTRRIEGQSPGNRQDKQPPGGRLSAHSGPQMGPEMDVLSATVSGKCPLVCCEL